ncbi:hypothetical protein LCGC14_3024270, partial [marine sediment metagenome]
AEAESGKSLKIKLSNIGLVAAVLIIIIFQISNPKDILWSYIGVGLTISEDGTIYSRVHGTSH